MSVSLSVASDQRILAGDLVVLKQVIRQEAPDLFSTEEKNC